MPLNHSRYVDRFVRKLDSVRLPWTTLGVLSVTLSLWVALLAGWVSMPSPVDLPPSAPGAMETAAISSGSIGAYLVMWAVMMAAMMFPAMLPFARRYADSLQGDWTDVTTALVAFFAAYGLSWAATGAVPLVIDGLVNVHDLVQSVPAVVFGGTLLFVGGYQLSGFKRFALRDCCGRVSVEDPDPRIAVRLGLSHARSCILATWHLFVFLVLAGSMNFFWMAGLTAIIVTERFPSYGREIADAVGVLAVVAGVLVLLPLPFPFP